jgi:hypothetical protein
MNIFRINIFGDNYTNFMLKFLPEIIGEREKNGIVRNDMIDLIIEWKKDKSNGIFEQDLHAQAAGFMTAGEMIKSCFEVM